MNKRHRKCDRELIDYDTKKLVAKKTDGVCSHCGKRIEIGGQFTVDHIIPLNKGGTNNSDNLVPLCKDCNLSKDDKIVPVEWYKYLHKDYVDEVKDVLDSFSRSYDSIGYNYFSSYDIIPYEYMHRVKNNIEVKLRKFIKKAVYSDLDKIYYTYVRYFEEHNVPYTTDKIKQSISQIFMYGAFYISEDTNSIIPVVPFGSSENGTRGILFWYPYTAYKNRSSQVELIGKMINNIESNILETFDTGYLYFNIWIPSNDTLFATMISMLGDALYTVPNNKPYKAIIEQYGSDGRGLISTERDSKYVRDRLEYAYEGAGFNADTCKELSKLYSCYFVYDDVKERALNLIAGVKIFSVDNIVELKYVGGCLRLTYNSDEYFLDITYSELEDLLKTKCYINFFIELDLTTLYTKFLRTNVENIKVMLVNSMIGNLRTKNRKQKIWRDIDVSKFCR